MRVRLPLPAPKNMPRKLYFDDKPKIINYVSTSRNHRNVIEIATTNKNKLKEFESLIKGYTLIPVDLDVDEIQDTDHLKVAKAKAKTAWEANSYNPVLIEDTSLYVNGLNDLPGALLTFFISDIATRKLIASQWLKGKDRSALAVVTLAIFDGNEVYFWEGKLEGEIADFTKGQNGFGFDDIFIPKHKNNPNGLTFAQMSQAEKNKISMRKLAVELMMKDIDNVRFKQPLFMLPEPYANELYRVRLDELQNKKAIKFAYTLECLETIKPDSSFNADVYKPITIESDIFYSRYILNPKSSSLGLLLTDVDRDHLKIFNNGDPVLWQMGPERRHLALCQRADFFISIQSNKVHNTLDKMESKEVVVPNRSNRRIPAIEEALMIKSAGSGALQAVSLKEIGYKKLSAENNVSRTEAYDEGLYNVIGKYPRSIYGIGCLPPVSGWRDVIVTGAIGHMMVFIHRNSLNAAFPERQISLAKESINAIKTLKLDKKKESRALRNIGAALGVNPQKALEQAKKLYDVGVKLFRIYTINSDPRVVQTAYKLRRHFNDDIEIFCGQIADKNQAFELIDPKIRVDGLVFGHGGGRQCTSATNGMAFTALEELYSITTDHRFNQVSLVQEAGVGKSVGALFIIGVDSILYNQQLAHCVIEQGDIMFEHRNGEPCQPYHGSASAPTFIIESTNQNLIKSRLSASGRAKKIEGKPGYRFYEEKANTMCFYIDEFKHYAARTLADLGVKNFAQLREISNAYQDQYIRIVTDDAQSIASAYK